MEHTEIYEQLYYNVSIIYGLTSNISSQTYEVLSEMVESPERIKKLLQIFENLAIFKNLSFLNHKMANLLKLIMNEQPSSFI